MRIIYILCTELNNPCFNASSDFFTTETNYNIYCKIQIMKNLIYYSLILIFFTACTSGTNQESTNESEDQSTEETVEMAPASVSFILPHEGDTVSSPVRVTMGVTGMEIEPAGEVREGFGHHHLIIDGSFIPAGEIVPADSTHIHYGQGQTEVEIELSPGNHTITMQFADGVHASFGEDLSATINVVVVE